MDRQLADYLKTRRTIPAAQQTTPAPDAETLRAMLTIAARVPDHGKLAPWRFVIFDAASRGAAVEGLARIAATHPDPREAQIRAAKAKGFGDAPLVVGLYFAPVADHPKIPLWEQELSAGAAGMNLMHAAAAYGFAAQWLTGWYASDPEAAAFLGVRDGERVAGFFHIGTPAAAPVERDRPDVEAITRVWKG